MRARFPSLSISSASGDGSDGGSSKSREGNLRRVLDVVKDMYEYKVARWNDERHQGAGAERAV